jgi:UDP-glucose 4-epimerase
VNGARTDAKPFTEEDPPAPVEPYARSKWEAEQTLRRQAGETGVKTVVVRPPLIYGPGVKGNFLRLLRLASSGIPLPIGSIRNRRNFVGVQNLCDLLILCTENPRAAGQLYLAADPDVHSTADLFRALCNGLNRPCRLWPVPVALIKGIVRITGFEGQFNKLCGSLEVCSDKARNELGWTPSVPFEEEIARTTSWFLRHERARGQ